MSDQLDFRNIEMLPVDFEETFAVLINRIKDRMPTHYTDFLESSMGNEILSAIAYEATLLSYMLNMSVNELYLPTAKTETGIYRLAKTIGYKPSGPSQSSVVVRFYIPTEHNNIILIPKYTRVQGSSISFYTIEDATIVPGGTYVDVPAKSGTMTNEVFVSTGVARYGYKLTENPVNVIESIIVNTGYNSVGAVYKQVDFIDINSDIGQYYTVEYDEEFYAIIRFGDGVYGVNPQKGVMFDVTYVINGGDSDNLSAYSITTILDLIYDTNNTIISNISVVNPQPAVGGSNSETPEEVKKNAPSIYSSQNRFVTIADYENLIGAYPGVFKVRAIDYKQLDEIGIFGVKVVVIPNGSFYLNKSFKEELMAYCDEKKIVATQVDIIDPSYIAFDVTANIKINSYNLAATVITDVRKIIYNYINYTDRDFGGEVSTSELYSKIREVSGVMAVSDISITENTKIYVSKEPTPGTNILDIVDNTGSLNSGCTITILSQAGAYITRVKVGEIDIEKSTIEILDPITNDPYIIEDGTSIKMYCSIYPVILVDGNYVYGDKEINVKAYDIVTEYDLGGSYANSYKIYNLLNMSYMTIYFGTNVNVEYQIMYVNGDTLYLDRELEMDIENNTEITLINKKIVPILASSVSANTSQLQLTSYPRFNIGSSIVRRESITYGTAITIMTKGVSTMDYLSSTIDVTTLVRIDKVYVNENKIFSRGVDYNLAENDRIIVWTNIGITKINVNSTYNVQYVKKTIYDSKVDLVHKVTNITGKFIEVTPPIPVALSNGKAFDVQTDTYVLLPYEISTAGNIKVNVV